MSAHRRPGTENLPALIARLEALANEADGQLKNPRRARVFEYYAGTRDAYLWAVTLLRELQERTA